MKVGKKTGRMGKGKERNRGIESWGRGNERGGKGKRKRKRWRGNRGRGNMDEESERGKYEKEGGTEIIKKKVKMTWDNWNGKREEGKEERAREKWREKERKEKERSKATVGQWEGE
jgi:hypothetical protein